MTVAIRKWGNSQGIRIPKDLLDTLKWEENEQITIVVEGGKLIMEKEKHRKNIKELFEEFDGEYEQVEMDWGETVGDEIW